MATLIQRAFSAGELTPSLYYRVDLARHAIGLRTMRNCYTLKQGGAENRPGTQFIGEIKASSALPRLIPFVNSSNQSYILEFGNLYMRVYKDGAVMKLAAQTISAITNANPAVVTYVGSDTYANGDEVYISGVVGMTEVNGRHFKVANRNTGANTFELTDLGGTNINSTGYGTYSSGGTIEEIYELTTTYTTANVAAFDAKQSGGFLYIGLDGGYKYLEYTNDTSWALYDHVIGDTLTTSISPSLSIPNGSAVTYEAVQLDSNDNVDKSGFTDTGNANPSSGSPITVTITCDSAAAEIRVYRADTIGGKISQDRIFGLVGIVGQSAGTATFVDNGITPDYTEDVDSYEEFAAGNIFTFYQGRLVTGSGSTIVGSAIGNISTFSANAAATTDASAFKFSNIGGRSSNIKHLVDFGKLVVLAYDGEFVAFGNESGIVTPTAVNIRRQSSYGAYDTRPIVVDSTLFFVQAGGSVVRAFGYDIAGDGYRGTDVTVFSSHLFRGYTVEKWDFQRNPHNILWCVRSDGTLLGFTYDKENEMSAWHRHDLPGAVVEDVAVVREGSDDMVYLLCHRTIDGRSVRYIERMASRYPTDVRDYKFMDAHLSYDGRNTGATTMTLSGGTTWAYDETLTLTASASYFSASEVGNQIHLTGADGEVIRFTIAGYSSATVVTGTPHRTVPASLQGVATATWSRAVDQVSGLWHIEGESVSVFADGFVVANPNNDSYDVLTVTDGAITLDKCYAVIHVGLPYLSDLETLDIDTVQGETMIDKNKLTNHVTLGVESTRGLWAGPRPPSDDATDPKEGLVEFKLRSDEAYDEPTELKTEPVDVVISGDFNSHGRVFIRQLDPVPMTVLAIAPAGLFPFRGA